MRPSSPKHVATPALIEKITAAIARGLLEMILVFAIVVGAAAAAFMVYQNASAGQQANQMVDEVNVIAGNIRTSSWGVTHNYSTLSETGQWIAGVFPQNWNVNGLAYAPETSNQAYVGPGVSPTQFFILINYAPVSSAECSKILDSFAAQGVDDLWAAGSGPSDVGSSVCSTTNPCKVNPSQVTYWCSGAQAADSPGTIGFQVFMH